MEITVIKQTIALSRDDTLIRGSERTYTADFVFDATWDGFTKTAHFKAGTIAVSVPLTDDSCVVPSELLTNAGYYLKVSVTGVKDGAEQATPFCLISRILYDTVIDIPIGTCPGGSAPTGEVGRLCDDFEDALASGYTEEELKDKSLSEVIGEMDSLDNTATDAEVEATLNEVWGAE